jgi:hypothetical protein
MEIPAFEVSAEETVFTPLVTRDRDAPWNVGDNAKRAGARRIADPSGRWIRSSKTA